MDLDDWFRGLRDWRTLLDLVDQLPKGSRYRAALSDDEDVAELVLATGGVRTVDRPPLEGFTAEMEQFLRIERLLMLLLYKGSGEKPVLPKGPETAIDRVEYRNFSAKKNNVIGQLLPGE